MVEWHKKVIIYKSVALLSLQRLKDECHKTWKKVVKWMITHINYILIVWIPMHIFWIDPVFLDEIESWRTFRAFSACSRLSLSVDGVWSTLLITLFSFLFEHVVHLKGSFWPVPIQRTLLMLNHKVKRVRVITTWLNNNLCLGRNNIQIVDIHLDLSFENKWGKKGMAFY